MTNGIGHRVIAISRIFLNDQWKFLPWWLLSKSEYNVAFWGYYQRNLLSNYLTKIEPRQYYNLFRFQSSVRLGSSSNSK